MTQEILNDIETVVQDCDFVNRASSAINITRYIKKLESTIEAISKPKVVYTDFKKVNLAKSMGFIK